MPNSVINYTANGVPYLDADNYLAIYPAYTAEIAAKLEQVGSPTAAVLELLTQALAARDAALAAKTAAEAARDALTAMPRAREYRADSFDHTTSGGYQRITGWTESYDTAAAFDPTTGFFTVPSTGLYAITAGLQFAANATGRRILIVEKGTAAPGTNTPLTRAEFPTAASPAQPGAAVACEVQLTAGDQVAAVAYQSSGGTLAIRGDTAPVYLTVRRVA